MNSNLKSEVGVYYRTEDYGSLWRRFIAAGLDFIILMLFFLFIARIWSVYSNPPDLSLAGEFGWLAVAFFNPTYFWLCTALAYVYLALIKRSRIRTIGYRIVSLRIVDMDGNTPSILKMSWRFILLIFGPFHVVVDLVWLGGDDYRQALRDKLANTYVVAVSAVPIGSGPIIYNNYQFFGMSFLFREVDKE